MTWFQFSLIHYLSLQSTLTLVVIHLNLLPDRVNARAHAFPDRVVIVWNRLPADVVRSSFLLAFKNSLII